MPRTRWFPRFLLALAVCASVSSLAQGIPSDQWTEKERQFVGGARGLYLQQGLPYTDQQAAVAVWQMRQQQQQQQQQAPVPQGVPEAQWTAQERVFVDMARKQYLAQGMGFSPEQAEIAVLAMRTQVAKMVGAAGAFQAAAQAGVPVMPMAPVAQSQPVAQAASTAHAGQGGGAVLGSEAALAAVLASWPPKPPAMDMVERRDGFDLNGRAVLDPEGKMFGYAADPISGAITYAVKHARGLTIKAVSAADPGQTLVIANGTQGPAGWEFTTVSGQRLSGDTLSVLSDGFLVGRTASAFKYKTGQGVTSIAIPNGYFLAPLQRGNVGASGHVLVEREMATGGNDPLSNMVSSFKTIGAILGTNKKEDFALLNITSGKLFPLNISANGKSVQVLSQCRQRNWLVNECQRMQTFESLYGADGSRNNSHYYWLVNWVGTAAGPMALTLEDGLANLYLTDLHTGKKVLALNRSLGIAEWQMLQRPDGAIGVKARLAFEWKEIPDVVQFVQAN